MHSVFHLRQAGVQNLGQPLEGRLNVLLLLQQLAGVVQGLHRALLFFVEALHSAVGGVQQGLCVGQAGVLAVELAPFTRRWRKPIDLSNLPGQPLALGLQAGLSCLRLR